MLSFSSQPRFLCPPLWGRPREFICAKWAFVCGLFVGFLGWFFFKHCRSLGGKNQKRNDLGFPKCSLDWDFSAGHCLVFYLCWKCCLVAQLGFQSPPRICSVPFFCSLFFFWRPGRNFVILSRLNGHLVFPGSGGTSPPWFLRDRWHPLDTDLNPQHRHLSVPYVTWEI